MTRAELLTRIGAAVAASLTTKTRINGLLPAELSVDPADHERLGELIAAAILNADFTICDERLGVMLSKTGPVRA